MSYSLTEEEQKKLVDGVRALSTIHDLEGHNWETLLAYVKGIKGHTRSQELFDVVDRSKGIGWSVKARMLNKIEIGSWFDVVIQRADIFKKAYELGYESLTVDTDPQILGEALSKCWNDLKIRRDEASQGVTDSRISVLIRLKDKETFAYYEDELELINNSEIVWSWTDSTKTGLQGIRRSDGIIKYKWLPSQKQFSERIQIPEHTFIFTIPRQHIPFEDVIKILNKELDKKPNWLDRLFNFVNQVWYKNSGHGFFPDPNNGRKLS